MFTLFLSVPEHTQTGPGLTSIQNKPLQANVQELSETVHTGTVSLLFLNDFCVFIKSMPFNFLKKILKTVKILNK